jgi:hypothetical protein
VRNSWSLGEVSGEGLVAAGDLSQITDDGNGTVSIRVSTDGVNRTFIIGKPGAHVRIEAPGTITITEARNA